VDSTTSLPRRDSFVSTKDVASALVASAAVAFVAKLDGNIAREAPESNSAFARNVARGSEKLGNPLYIAPALGVTWLAGRISGHPGLSASSARIAGGIAASAAVASGMKLVAGRARPGQSDDDGDRGEFEAFSGHTAFPSGHTTVAFSLAAGIDHETDARWVPYIVYPVAGLVGWSRLRDNRHWASDVLAGALVGVWTTHKFQSLVRQGHRPSRLELDLVPAPDAPGIGARATLKF
jgi:membrane-associated phospholipid phosphatase